jgi:hypothetical protein
VNAGGGGDLGGGIDGHGSVQVLPNGLKEAFTIGRGFADQGGVDQCQ